MFTMKFSWCYLCTSEWANVVGTNVFYCHLCTACELFVLTLFAPVGWPKRWERRWLGADENNKTFQPETFGLLMHVQIYHRPLWIFRNQPCSGNEERKKNVEFLLLLQLNFSNTIKHIGLLLIGCLAFPCVYVIPCIFTFLLKTLGLCFFPF